MAAPTNQWLCDTCNTRINSPDDGTLEWTNATGKSASFRICDRKIASPRTNGCTVHVSPNEDLVHLVGRNGLAHLLAILDPGPIVDPKGQSIPDVEDVRAWVEVVRRLLIPQYEEARPFIQIGMRNGYYEGTNEVAPYNQDELAGVIHRKGIP